MLCGVGLVFVMLMVVLLYDDGVCMNVVCVILFMLCVVVDLMVVVVELVVVMLCVIV